jgi:hypothetical protein
MADGHIPYTRLTHEELTGLRGGHVPTPSTGRGAWLVAGGLGLAASVLSLVFVQLATGGARLSYWGMRAAVRGFRSPPTQVIRDATHGSGGGGHGKGAGLAVIILVAVALVVFAFELLGAKLAVCLAIGLAAMIVTARRLDAPMPELAAARGRSLGPPRRRR